MSILDTNNNSLREFKYNLSVIKIPDNTLEDNGDLMDDNWWLNYITTTNQLNIPISNIDTMVKTQSIWWRNEDSTDYINIKISNNYKDNMLEFINKGIKNIKVNFSSLEEVLFIVSFSYINEYGSITNRPMYIGRPTISNYSNTEIKFKINELDVILKSSDFTNNVLEKSTASFYNFIGLKKAYELIYNTPHDEIDDYSYPVIPFKLDTDVYVPAVVNTVTETPVISASYEAYAEDFIYGSNGTKKNIYYYRDSPECGIITLTLDSIGNIISSDTFNMSEMQYIINPSEVPYTYEAKKYIDNYFRLFRPINSFIAEEDNFSSDDLKVFKYEDGYIETEYITESNGISKGDEIVLVELKVEIFSDTDEDHGFDQPHGRFNTLMFKSISNNVYYMNKTKGILYANVMIVQKQSYPFPIQWLELRKYGYFDIPIVWDSHYESDNGDYLFLNSFWSYELFKQTGKNGDSSYIRTMTKINDECNKKYLDFTIEEEANVGWNNGSKVILSKNDTIPLETADKLEYISKVKYKNLKIKNDKIYWLYGNTQAEIRNHLKGDQYKTTVANKSFWDFSVQLYDSKTSFYNDGKRGIISEISINNKFVGIFEHMNYIDKIVLFDDETELLLCTSNQNSYSFNFKDNKFFQYQNIYEYDNGYSIIKSYTNGWRVLDINYDIDKVIVKDLDNLIRYQNISDDELKYSYDSPIYWLLSMDRIHFAFLDTTNGYDYVTYTTFSNNPIRLLGYSENRLKASIGLSNSYFKNMYSDNYGVKQIRNWNKSKSITLTDSEIYSLDETVLIYNKIDWVKYNSNKNSFTNIDNDEADSKVEDELNYDEALNINIYSNKDVNLRVNLYRNASNLNVIISNEFGREEFEITPVSYSSFEIICEGIYDDIILQVNFYDAELEVNKRFIGEINRKTLEENGSADSIIETGNKLLWKDDNVVSLKFPFLYTKYSEYFLTEMEKYWLIDSKIRKVIQLTVVVSELLLLNEDYSVFNIGEQTVIIDSDRFYLNGYKNNNGTIENFNDNRMEFYIEKLSYNFEKHKTTVKLISI